VARIAFLLIAVAAVSAVVGHMALVSGQADKAAAAVFVTTIPPGYRDWRLISVATKKATSTVSLRFWATM